MTRKQFSQPFMKRMARAAAVCLLAGAAAAPVCAVDFGTLRLYTPAGQRPYAEINLSDNAPLDPADIRARIATPDAYSVAGMRYTPSLQGVVISTQAAASGQVMLRLDQLPLASEAPEVELLLLVGDRMSLSLGEYRIDLRSSNREFAAAQAGSRLAEGARPGAPTAAVRPGNAEPVAAASTSAVRASAPADTSQALESSFVDVEAAINAWAAAWSQRDVDAYVAAYVPDFAGRGKNLTRAAWLAQRRSRILARKSISIDLSKLAFTTSGNAVVATFDQVYRGDALEERSRKRLVMVQIDRRWLIRDESELP